MTIPEFTNKYQTALSKGAAATSSPTSSRPICARASLLLAQGVHPRVVMEQLGHSQIALTMDTYSHVIPALERDAADRLNAFRTSL